MRTCCISQINWSWSCPLILLVIAQSNKDTLESDLRAAFAAHGSVSKVQMPTDRNTVRIMQLHRILNTIAFSSPITDAHSEIWMITYYSRDDPVVLHLLPCPMNRSIPLQSQLWTSRKLMAGQFMSAKAYPRTRLPETRRHTSNQKEVSFALHYWIVYYVQYLIHFRPQYRERSYWN